MNRIFGSLEDLDVDALNLAYVTLEKGYNSMPINVPGTKYYESMKVYIMVLIWQDHCT